MNLDFELISAEEFEGLPEDDEQCFVEFEAICRRNMTRMINEQTGNHFDRSVQVQYMAAVSSVAVECGLTSLARSIPAEDDNSFYADFSEFSLAVQGEVARIRIRGRRSRNSVSVQLTDNTRTKIEHYMSRLRETINKSSLPDHRKKALRDKLDQLTEELGKRRLHLGKTMVVLAVVMAGLQAGLEGAAHMTTIAAEGEAAVSSIMRLIGVDKETEEAAVSRLAPPLKALPAPPSHARARPAAPSLVAPSRVVNDLDDDIPF
jgi:hypothetical protein